MARYPDSVLTQLVDTNISNQTAEDSINPIILGDTLKAIIDSKVNKSQTSQGAFKYYAPYDASTGLDFFGDPIPAPTEQNQGIQYVVTVEGEVDLNGEGTVAYNSGDILTCLYIDSAWKWVLYGNIYGGGSSLPEGTTGQVLINAYGEWIAYNSLFDTVQNISIDHINRAGYSEAAYQRFTWNEEFTAYSNDSTPVLTAGNNGVTIRSVDGHFVFDGNSGQLFNTSENTSIDINAHWLIGQEGYTSVDYDSRELKNTDGVLRAAWPSEFTTYNDSTQQTFSAGQGLTTSYNGLSVFTDPSDPVQRLAIDAEAVKVLHEFGVFGPVHGPILQVGDAGFFFPKLLADNPWIPSLQGATLGIEGAGNLVAMDPPLVFDNYRDTYHTGSGALLVQFKNRTTATSTFNATGAVTLSLAYKNQTPFKDWDDNATGGGLYILHLKNNVTGTPRVFTFDSDDFKLETGTTITVGSALDSAPKVLTVMFFYYNGKLREISRSAGTGILLD